MTLEEDHKQSLDHITTLQERCNELLNNERGAKRDLNNLISIFIASAIGEDAADKPSNTGLCKSVMEIIIERGRQDLKWGELDTKDFLMPDGTGEAYRHHANDARSSCDLAAKEGRLTWRHILMEEVMEALAEDDPEKLAKELVQISAVGAKWLETIHRRQEGK